MSETITIKVSISIWKIGSECEDEFEILREDWESMTDQEKEDMCRDAAFSMISWDFMEKD